MKNVGIGLIVLAVVLGLLKGAGVIVSVLGLSTGMSWAVIVVLALLGVMISAGNSSHN